MLYLSRLLGKTVRDSGRRHIGRVSDCTVAAGEPFPTLTSLVVVSGGRMQRAAWSQVQSITANQVLLKVNQGDLSSFQSADNEILLRGELMDRQIVDTQGTRVVRVNDLQLNAVDDGYRLAGVDVGTLGILRRLGLERIVLQATGRLGQPLGASIIPWDQVQAFHGKGLHHLTLTTTRQKLVKLHPADLAEILTDLHGAERDNLFLSLDAETAAEALQEMEEDLQVSLLNTLDDHHASDILEEMDPDEAADLLGELPEERARELLDLMEDEEAQEVEELLTYPEESAGGIMTTEFVSLRPEMTVDDTIELLRRTAPEAETIYYLYVTDPGERLLGVLSLRDLIVSPPRTAISSIMTDKVVSVDPAARVREVAELVNKYALLAIPVLEKDRKLLGIITVDDVMELMVENS